MALQQEPEVHPVELVPRENENQLVGVIGEVDQVLAHGVGGALVPPLALGALLRRQDLDEAVGEAVEPVALLDMAMQGAAVELGEEADAPQVGVEAVADRDVHDPVLPAQRDRGLGPVLGERKEPGAGTAAEDDGQDVLRSERRAPGGHTLPLTDGRSTVDAVSPSRLDLGAALGAKQLRLALPTVGAEVDGSVKGQ